MGGRKNFNAKKMKPQPILSAFKHAFNGAGYFIRHDRNGRIHFIAAILVLVTGFCFKVSVAEWCILLICIALVTGFEMLNHALENLCDVVHEEYHPLIKTVKDVAAAAVLWSAIVSAVIGLLIFVPKISALV
jgi:undecaprenol kinase/diacylglycerol kinase (ATP)